MSSVLLYTMGNMSHGMIARLFGVSEVAVFKWLRAAAAALPEPTTPAEVEIVQLDEMGHFVDGKKTSRVWKVFAPLNRRGFDRLLGPGFWVSVTMRPAESSSPGSASKAASS